MDLSSAKAKDCFVIQYSSACPPRFAKTIGSTDVPQELRQWLFEFLTKELLQFAEEDKDNFFAKLLFLEDLDTAAVIATFCYAEVASFTVCLCFRGKQKQRLQTIFPSVRDYLENVFDKILNAEDSLPILDEWGAALEKFIPVVEGWLRSSFIRGSWADTLLPPAIASPSNPSLTPPLIASTVTTAMSHHRCIVRGDDKETVRRWVQTIAMFMLDTRLAFATDECAEDAEDIVPDLHLQGTTASAETITPELLMRHFRYPVCVIDIDHLESPNHLLSEVKLLQYRESRWKLCVMDQPSKDTSTAASMRERSVALQLTWQRLMKCYSAGRISICSAIILSWRKTLFLKSLGNVVREVYLKEANQVSPLTLRQDEPDALLTVAVEQSFPLQFSKEERVTTVIREVFDF